MKKISILTLAIGFLLASCGETPKTVEENEMAHDEIHEDGVEHEDHHDHDAMVEETETEEPAALPEGAKVFFANLEDGQTIKSPVKIEFGVEGMEVEPAGALNDGKGHHHVIVDGSYLGRGTVVPADETNIHFGKGQLETELELTPGEHTLTLQFADGYHLSYGEQMSASINVIVE